LRIAAVARLRARGDAVGLALRRGRQYLREVADASLGFRLPKPGELVAWSRILHDREVLICLNTSGTTPVEAHVTIDAGLHPTGAAPAPLRVLYRGDWSDAELASPPAGETLAVSHVGGRAVVRVTLPPAGMTIAT
jgi:hypothetical protein